MILVFFGFRFVKSKNSINFGWTWYCLSKPLNLQRDLDIQLLLTQKYCFLRDRLACLILSNTSLRCFKWSSRVSLKIMMLSRYAPVNISKPVRTFSQVFEKIGPTGEFLRPNGIYIHWNWPCGVTKLKLGLSRPPLALANIREKGQFSLDILLDQSCL